MELSRSLLAIPFLTVLAVAQRSAAPAQPAASQDSERKLPAPPTPVGAPILRDTRGLTPGAPAIPKTTGLDSIRASDRIPRARLYFAARPDGSPQAHGRTFKAEFTPSGTTYTPFCGSSAPESHPLTLRLEDIRSGAESVAFAGSVTAERQGDVVRFARGSVSEVYALGLDSLEQTFVFETLPSTSELVLRLACTTGMSAVCEGGAILFSSADGTVRYGVATAFDAKGASVHASTALVGGEIEIRVPAEFLATAAFPVTIDPLITTYSVAWGGTSYDDFAPAVAWDETNQRYCTVLEEVFSATDHDVIYVFSDPSGAFLWAGYVNLGGDYWANPDVANNNQADQFFIVAEVGSPSGGTRTIHGMTLEAGPATLGADLVVSPDQIGEKINPTVGGDPFLGTSYYTVFWQRIYSSGDNDIHGRQVNTAGVLLGGASIMLDNSAGTLDRHPRISKSCQQYGMHHVVWERIVSPTLSDIYAAEVSWSGSINLPSTQIITGGNTALPACSPMDSNNDWMLVCEIGTAPDHDVYAKHLTGLSTNDTFNLTMDEHLLGAGNLFQDQRSPAVDTDGNHFAVSYSEQYGSSTSDYDVYVSTVDRVGVFLMPGEIHQSLAATGAHEDFPRMCSQQAAGGSGNRLGIVWSADVGGTDLRDVDGAVYATGDFDKLCTPSDNGVVGCPCGNPGLAMGRGCNNSSGTGGASLNGAGNASLAGDTASLSTFGEKPTAPSMVAQGSTLIGAGAAFGQGVRCTGGALKRLYLKIAVGGSITAPSGSDPSLSARSATMGDPLSPGSIRYYFVYYRDPVVLGGCPASSGFNATDTVRVLWRP